MTPEFVDCQHRCGANFCGHSAAPRNGHRLATCVVQAPPEDPRLRGCALILPHGKPVGPPNQLIRPWP